MKVMILGSGGREHALAWKLSQSDMLDELYILPGNAGTNEHGENLTVRRLDFSGIVRKCYDKQIDMLVVGPEAYLAQGLKDYLKTHPATKDIKVVGPDKAAALLESSKEYAKKFMNRYKIPTAAYMAVTKENLNKGLNFLKKQTPPFVLKADGLAAGKGVIICEEQKEAVQALTEMIDGKFGEASKTVLVEEFLQGIEMSVFALTDGRSYKILPEAKDYKRVGEKDTGLNTGGMGAISPVSFASPELMKKIDERVIQPTIRGLQNRNFEYHGFLFFGLMIVDNDPYVIEYNVRMGDPEAEVVLPRIKSDLLQHLNAVFGRKFDKEELVFDDRAAATVMLTSGGYPEAYEKGKKVSGLDKVKDSLVFHAGTKESKGQVLTS